MSNKTPHCTINARQYEKQIKTCPISESGIMGRERKQQNNLKTNKRVSEISSHIDVDAELDKALSFHRAGNLKQAEEGYRKILKESPQNEDALHFLGVLVFQSGQTNS